MYLIMSLVQLYDDLIQKLPEFVAYDVMGREHYIEDGISPLGQIGVWLNQLAVRPNENQTLIIRICNYLNDVYTHSGKYSGDIVNDFNVYFFWALEYPTINAIKPLLNASILADGRRYLQVIDGENYQPF